MKFLKNKFFIIALSVAIFAVIFTATLSLMGVTDPFKDLINTASVPLRCAGIAVKDSIDGFRKYFTAIDDLYAENKDLKDQVNSLLGQLADANAVKEENERLQRCIGYGV